MSILGWIAVGWVVFLVICGIVLAVLAWLAPVADEEASERPMSRHE